MMARDGQLTALHVVEPWLHGLHWVSDVVASFKDTFFFTVLHLIRLPLSVSPPPFPLSMQMYAS